MTDRQARRILGLVVFLFIFGWMVWVTGESAGLSEWIPWLIGGSLLLSPLAAAGWRRYAASSSPRTAGSGVGIAAAGIGLALYKTLPEGALCLLMATALWAFTGLTLLATRRWSRGQELWAGEAMNSQPLGSGRSRSHTAD